MPDNDDNNNNNDNENVVPFLRSVPPPIPPNSPPVDAFPSRDITVVTLDGNELHEEGFLGVYPDFVAVGKNGDISLVVPMANIIYAKAVDKKADSGQEENQQ